MIPLPAGQAFLSHRPRMVKILGVVDEAPNVKSFTFRDKLSASAMPGQFGMVWVPGIDETPMSLRRIGPGEIASITVKERGEGTRELLGRREGDLIGIRGPYGKGFTYNGEKNVLMIGGGTGAIPLVALVRDLAPRGVKCSFILGANTSRDLLFAGDVRQLSIETRGFLSITTEDGSAGTRGLATDEAARFLVPGAFDHVYTCGPEIMMKKVVDLAIQADIPVQVGLERIFKCGSGICGSCCVGPYLVCKDGPVFGGNILKDLPEFGKLTRDASGRRVAVATR